MENQSISTDVQPAKGKNVYRILRTVLVVIAACLLALLGLKELRYQIQLVNAQGLINQGRFSEAIRVLDETIARNPDRIKAYQLRATAFGNSRSNNFSEQVSYFVYSLYDLDKMVALEPDNGDHYVNRNLILRELANIYNDSATKFAIYELAGQNAEKAIEVGVSPDYSYVYRHHARNLIQSNHCEEGLKETQQLISQTSPQDPILDTYNIYLTEAYLCLNELDQALVTAQQLKCDDPVATCKSGFLAEIYYQSGEWENALDTLNRMIQTNPNYGAWRYYLRADILYELGQEEYAQQELDRGQKYSWFGNGVYWYVNAKMAFDKGDDENGLLYLQYAESTLDVQYNPLRQKILAEIKNRGGTPLALQPQIPYNAPPIP